MLSPTALRRWSWTHKWSSLVCTVFMLLLCITGLPLIFHHEIGHLLGTEVEAPAMPANTPRASLDQVLATAQALHPDRVVQFASPAEDDDNVWFVTLTPTPAPTDDFRSVAVDARTAQVLAQPRFDEGFMHVMFRLHVDLFAGLPAERETDPLPDGERERADREGDEPDDSRGNEGVRPDRRESDSDREGVDARGDGEREHDPLAREIALLSLVRRAYVRVRFFLPFLVYLEEHLSPDEGEEAERDPMVDARDQRAERGSQEPARDRHEKLEKPEGDRGAQHVEAREPFRARGGVGPCVLCRVCHGNATCGEGVPDLGYAAPPC